MMDRCNRAGSWVQMYKGIYLADKSMKLDFLTLSYLLPNTGDCLDPSKRKKKKKRYSFFERVIKMNECIKFLLPFMGGIMIGFLCVHVNQWLLDFPLNVAKLAKKSLIMAIKGFFLIFFF